MSKKEQIEQQMEALQQKLDKINKLKRDDYIRPLSSYKKKEKVAAFDRLYEHALGNIEYLEKEGYNLKDQEHWCFETMMELLSKDQGSVWTYYNNLGP